MKPKFKRVEHNRFNVADAKGTVQIVVELKRGNNRTKGNITRSARVQNAKVSAVWRVVERALFGAP